MAFNKVILEGRLTKDIEVKSSQSGKHVTRFYVAVNRKKKDAGADFISCVAWNQCADLLKQYFKKGDGVLLEGSWSTGSYKQQDGTTVYTNDCLVSSISFPESKARETAKVEPRDPDEGLLPPEYEGYGCMSGTEDMDLPF